MSATPAVVARLEAWLSDERVIEDKVQQLRNLLCDVVWAGDDLCTHGASGDPQYAQAWREVGGQRALDAFDNIARDIADALERRA